MRQQVAATGGHLIEIGKWFQSVLIYWKRRFHFPFVSLIADVSVIYCAVFLLFRIRHWTDSSIPVVLRRSNKKKYIYIWKENKTTVRWICYIPAISFRVPFQVHLQNVGSIISILIGSQVFGFRIPALEKFTAELNRSKIVKVSSFIAIFGRFQTNALSYFWPSRWLLFPTCFLIIPSSLIQI